MSISENFSTGVNEHLNRIKNYLNPDGTGSLAGGLNAVRAIHLYAYNIYDTTEMSFSALLRTYPDVEKAFSEFLNGSDIHDQKYFSSEEFDAARKNHNLVLMTQDFLETYKNQIIQSLQYRMEPS